MTRSGLLLAAGAVFLAGTAEAQSPAMVKYCRDLTASYRKAVSDGKPPVPRAGQAIADCPTNPDASVRVLEGVLKELGVALPART